jgi:hypothetical protein
MQVTGGVVRWILDMMGATALAYLPNVAMVLCIGIAMVYDFATGRTTRGQVLFVVLVTLSATVGMVSTGNLKQVTFGLWVLLPFFFGLTSAPVILESHRHQIIVMVAMFLATTGGVMVHDTMTFPWVGANYQIGGFEMDTAREWQAGEKQRLSGLARSSFDVAGQILVAAALLSLKVRRTWLRAVIWAACFVGISLSTSKGILLTLAMTAIASECLIRRYPNVLRCIFFLGALWVFVPPVMGWTMDWSELARTEIDNPIYGSFLDRMNDMWPKAMELSTTHGLIPLGRGVGGIGVPLSLFEPALFNAGDNIFVYCWVISGVIALPLFICGFAALFRMCKSLNLEKIRVTLLLAIVVLWYGGVSNILEHALLACAMGIVCHVCAVFLATGESAFLEHVPSKRGLI